MIEIFSLKISLTDTEFGENGSIPANYIVEENR